MRHSFKTGLSFGITSGIITTLGLLIGLGIGTDSQLAVIGGILTIAIADAFSDAMGIHFFKESENVHSLRQVWEATIVTFLAKFLFALTFALPVLILPLTLAIFVGIIWGLFALAIVSLMLAKDQGLPSWRVVTEHFLIAFFVITASYYVGEWVARTF